MASVTLKSALMVTLSSTMYLIYGSVTGPSCTVCKIQTLCYSILTFLQIVALYRVTFHPLAKYPGPWWGALTDWYTVYHLVKGDRHLDFYRLHSRYGKIVRFGPRRISICSSSALHDIYSTNANVQRSQTYDSTAHFFGGTPSSNTTKDHREHAFRRRVNIRAMNPKTIKSMEEHILKNVRYFCSELVGFTGEWGKSKNMTFLVGCLVMDIMGDIVFGKNYNVMKRPDNRDLLKGLPRAVAGIHLTGYMPELLTLRLDKLLFQKLMQPVKRFTSLSAATFQWRFQQKSQNDLFASLLSAKDPQTGEGFSDAQLISESGLLMVAGSDTTITATTALIFNLLHSPLAFEKLESEVLKTFTDLEEIRIGPALHSCRFLYACIDETMRLTPSVGSIVPREILPGGLVVDGEYFPEGSDVGVPHYAIHHNPEYFPQPFDFIPERWLASNQDSSSISAGMQQFVSENEQEWMDPEPVRLAPNVQAFTPFGYGRTSCIGRYLAYQEMSIVVARLVWLFHMRLEPGSTLGEGSEAMGKGRTRKNEFQTWDRFLSMHDGPMVQFRLRDVRKT